MSETVESTPLTKEQLIEVCKNGTATPAERLALSILVAKQMEKLMDKFQNK